MTTLQDLKHITKNIPNSGKVIILDKGEIIDSEAEAMLQALHSRSVGGIKSHLEVLAEKGADNFMSKFYLGYGHKSIGDCGSITIFVEGISILAAKAIQDTRLYNGQEASTRYIDFSSQEVLNPVGSKNLKNLQEKQRKFYVEILPKIEKNLKEKYPFEEGFDEKNWQKTISVKAFDIARGFLSAGFTTNLAWHTNLRQVLDRVEILRNNPLEEVRNIAKTILEACIEKYPNSFNEKIYSETENYLNKYFKENYYFFRDENISDSEYFKILNDEILEKDLENCREILENRPNEKTNLPTFLENLGNVKIEFLLDYGSFRDLQRHRSLSQRMPILTSKYGFNNWYLQSSGENLKGEIQNHLKEIEEILEKENLSKEEKQYYLPIGYNVLCEVSGSLPALIYTFELRSQTTVHETLRKVSHKVGDYFDKKGIKNFVNKSEEKLDFKRGKQDIKLK